MLSWFQSRERSNMVHIKAGFFLLGFVVPQTKISNHHSISVFVSIYAPSSQSHEDRRANVSWAWDECNLNLQTNIPSITEEGIKSLSRISWRCLSVLVFFLIDGTNKLVLSVISRKVESWPSYREDRVNWCVRRANPYQIRVLLFFLFLFWLVGNRGTVLVASWSVTMCVCWFGYPSCNTPSDHHSMRMNYRYKKPAKKWSSAFSSAVARVTWRQILILFDER